MPSSACLTCFRLVPLGATYCEAHTPKRKDSQRLPSHLRGFDHEYRKNKAVCLKVGGPCVLCGKAQPRPNTADHIKPRHYGIDNRLTNLVPAHLSCNSKRQHKALTDEQKRRVAIYLYHLETYCNANSIPLP